MEVFLRKGLIYSRLPSLSSIFASSCSRTSILLCEIFIGLPFAAGVSLASVGAALIGMCGSLFRNFLFRTSNSSNTRFNSIMCCSFSSLTPLYASYLFNESIRFLEEVSSSFLNSIGSRIPTKKSSSSIYKLGSKSVLSMVDTLESTSSSSFAQVASSASSWAFNSAILSSKNLACRNFSRINDIMSIMSLYSSILTNTGALVPSIFYLSFVLSQLSGLHS